MIFSIARPPIAEYVLSLCRSLAAPAFRPNMFRRRAGIGCPVESAEPPWLEKCNVAARCLTDATRPPVRRGNAASHCGAPERPLEGTDVDPDLGCDIGYGNGVIDICANVLFREEKLQLSCSAAG